MADQKLMLRVILELKDKALAPLKRVSKASEDTAQALKATRDRLSALNKTQADVTGYRRTTAALRGQTRELSDLQGKSEKLKASLAGQSERHANVRANLKASEHAYKRLSSSFKEGRQDSAAFSRELELSRISLISQRQAYERSRDALRKYKDQIRGVDDASKRLRETIQGGQERLAGYKQRLEQAGVGTDRLGAKSRSLKGDIGALNDSYKAQTEQLKKLGLQQKRIQEINSQHARYAARAGMAAGAGYAMYAGGSTMLRGAAAPISEGKKYANEVLRILSLGLGEEASADSIKYARAMKTYGTSTTDNLGLMRDALTAFADVHHAEMVTPLLAKMKFANEAVYGAQHAEDNEKKFMDMLKVIELRGGLSSKDAFARQANIVQQVLTATGGRVGPEEWLNTIKTGGVAAKGIGDEAFYYQLEPLVQEMGGNRVGTALMSAYQNVYQGKTTKRAAQLMQTLGLIADPSKVKHDKVGQISQLGIGALKGSDIFRQNQFQWMEEVLLPTLAEKGITEKQQILDAIGGMFSNRTASNLFAQMYLQRDQIHKNAQLNARADGIDGLYDKARGSASGGELELLAKKRDLYNQISTDVMPLYVKMLEKAAGALDWLRRMAEQHPRLTKAMGVAVVGLSLAMAGMGLLIIPLALLAGKAVLGRFLLARLGLAIGQLGPISTLALKALTRLPTALTLLSISALMVYENWDGMKGGLVAIWEQVCDRITETIKGGLGSWLTLMLDWSPLGVLWSAFAFALDFLDIEVPDRFSKLGAKMIEGLKSGLGQGKDWVLGLLGIKSDVPKPSNTEVLDATNAMLKSTKPAPIASWGGSRAAALSTATVMGLGGAGLVQAQDTPVAPRMDTRTASSAMASSAAGGKSLVGGAGHQITINATPGMDPQAIARAVSAELDRRERMARSRVLSSMSDIN